MGFLSESFEAIDVFMERGGPVLNLIAILLFVKWSLMIERFWFLSTVHKKNVVNALSEWESRKDKKILDCPCYPYRTDLTCDT